MERRQDLGSNFIAAGAGRSGENVARVTVSDLEAVSSALRSRYGYETGLMKITYTIRIMKKGF